MAELTLIPKAEPIPKPKSFELKDYKVVVKAQDYSSEFGGRIARVVSTYRFPTPMSKVQITSKDENANYVQGKVCRASGCDSQYGVHHHSAGLERTFSRGDLDEPLGWTQWNGNAAAKIELLFSSDGYEFQILSWAELKNTSYDYCEETFTYNLTITGTP